MKGIPKPSIASILVKCDAEMQSPSTGFSFADEQLAI